MVRFVAFLFSITGLLAGLPAGLAAAVPNTMPLISRFVPIFASSAVNPATNANDASADTTWRSSGFPAWLALDLSGVPVGQRGPVLAVYTNNSYGYNLLAGPHYNNIAAYTLEANAGAGGGAPPGAGWVVLATVASNNLHSRQHALNLTGYNWIRINCTASDGSPLNVDAGLDLDIYDASAGYQDDWIFYGDSITAQGLDRTTHGGIPNFSYLVSAVLPTRYPAAECGGIPFLKSGDGLANLPTWLPLFQGLYVGFNYGTNDAGANSPAVFYANMTTSVQMILAAGKIPVIPKIPWARDLPHETFIPALNSQIDLIYANFPQVIPGPDLHTFYFNNQCLISPDDLHPSDAGYGAYRQQWAQAMLQTVYGQAAQPTSTPACGPPPNTLTITPTRTRSPTQTPPASPTPTATNCAACTSTYTQTPSITPSPSSTACAACTSTFTPTPGSCAETAQFNYEDGSLQGWLNLGGFITGISNSTTQAYACSRSLAVAIVAGAGSSGTIAVNNSGGSSPLNCIAAGTTITFRIWIPAGSILADLKPFTRDAAISWDGGYYGASFAGNAWNTFTVMVPVTAVLPISQVGIQFDNAGAGAETLYVDSISWTSSCAASATPTNSLTATRSNSATPTPSATGTATLSTTATFSATPSITLTATPSITLTGTPSITLTTTPSITLTRTPSITLTATPSITLTTTPSITLTRTTSITPTATPSITLTVTPSITLTVTPSTTPSPTPSFTASPIASATNTPTVTPSFSASPTPSASPSPSPSFTATPIASATNTLSITPSFSASPSATPSQTPSVTPTATSSATPSASSSATPSTTPSETPSGTPTASPSPSPSFTESPVASATPTASITVGFSATISSTVSPSMTFTVTPSPSDTISPSPSASVTPSLSASQTVTPSMPATATGTDTATPTTSASATNSSSSTVTPSESASPTATATWTETTALTATPVLSATATLAVALTPALTATPQPSGRPDILQLAPVPNPQAGAAIRLALHLAAPADSLELRVYTPALAVTGVYRRSGVFPAGWSSVSFDVSGLSSGLYYVKMRASGAGEQGQASEALKLLWLQ